MWPNASLSVACELGRLYNKDVVIEFLLKRDTFPTDVADHIRNLKDVIELNLTEKTAGSSTESDDQNDEASRQDSPFVCPVVGLEMNGKHRFCYLRTCGCVLSERALKEVKSETCHRCGNPFEDTDIIVLNGDPVEVESLRTKMMERRSKAKAERKDRKRKHTEGQTETLIKLKDGSVPTASSSSSKTEGKPEKKEKKSTSSIATDPNRSEAFKSLFTTHESAKNKPKSNWVTYNPLYF